MLVRAFFSTKKAIVRPSLRSLNAEMVQFIDSNGSLKEKVLVSELLSTYDENKFELLQVGTRDTLPLIKIFPKAEIKEKIKRTHTALKSLHTAERPREKTIEMNSTIAGNDFDHKMTRLLSFLAKSYIVKVILILRSISSTIDMENLFKKIKARIEAAGTGKIQEPVQQTSNRVQFIVKPTLASL